MKKSIILLMVVCGIILIGCSKKEDPVVPGELGDAAAELTGLEWVKGDPVTFQPGHVYVVEFWATWCPPCLASIPHLTELQAEYKDKVTIIGVSVDQDPVEKVKAFVTDQAEKMEYTVAYEAKGEVQKAYSRAFGERFIPHAFIVDQQGKIVWVGYPTTMDGVLKQVVEGTFNMGGYAEQEKQRELDAANLKKWYTDYFVKIESGSSEETTEIANKIIEKSSFQTLNSFAWGILTEVTKENRDLPTALKAAKKANDLTEGKSVAVLDTYALALFENGKIQEAITNQSRAVELMVGDPEVQKIFQKTLDEFKAALANRAVQE